MLLLESSHIKEEQMSANAEGSPIAELLRQLNELEQKYGRVMVERDPNYDPSGEANARIERIKERLADMGVKIEWDGWQYQVAHSPDTGGREII